MKCIICNEFEPEEDSEYCFLCYYEHFLDDTEKEEYNESCDNSSTED